MTERNHETPQVNLYERYELPADASLAVITERLRHALAVAPPPERSRVRKDWEALTASPERRLQMAMETFPETRKGMGVAPPRLPLLPLQTPLDIADTRYTQNLLALMDGKRTSEGVLAGANELRPSFTALPPSGPITGDKKR